MSAECVFGCRHPLWGGAGECITVNDSTVDESCACEAGYASRDSFGNPSCVPFEALVGSFATIATVAATVAAFTWWHIVQHMRLSQSDRRARKAVVRLRVIVSGSVNAGCNLASFCVAAARGGDAALWDDGMFYVTYGISYPSVLFCIVQVGEVWLSHLPPQLLKPGSVLAIIKRLTTEYDASLWTGFACSGGFALMASLSLVFGQRAVRRAIETVLMMSCIIAGVGFAAIATFLTRAINAAEVQNLQAWQKRARDKIRLEAGALSVAGAIYATCAGVLVFTRAGRNTPLIPYSIMLTVGMAGTAGAIHFSKPAGTTGSTSRLGPPPGIVSRVFEHGAREKVVVVGGGGGGALTPPGKPADRPDAAAIPPVGASMGKRSLRVVVPVIVHEPV